MTAGTTRQFRVQKDNGEFWNMNYASDGVSWTRSGKGFDAAPAASTGRLLPPLGGGPAAGAAELIEAVAKIGMWWELRQQRQLNQAAHEERRIPWLAEVIDRWRLAHAGGDRLDLLSAQYLAREAQGTLDALVGAKKAAIPQAMLHDIALILQTQRQLRELLRLQFEEIVVDPTVGLQDAVRSAMPGRKLDMEFIRSLAADPAAEWDAKIREKSSKGFDRDLAEAFRFAEAFVSRLFPSTELAVPELEEGSGPSLLTRIVHFVATALPRQLLPDTRSDGWEKRDMFRELALLPAEVSRVRALHTAWMAAEAVVWEATGHGVSVLLGPSSVLVGLEPAPQQVALPPRGGDTQAAGHDERQDSSKLSECKD